MIRDGTRPKFMEYFKKPVDPKEMVRKWQADVRTQQRHLEKEIRDIQREEQKAVKLCKDAAKRNDIASCKIMAKELLHTRKAIKQLYTNKAQMVAMNATLSEQLATVKVAGTLSKSTEVMKMMNDLIKIPQLNRTMAEMSREMMKAGMIDEIMDDAIDSALDSEDMEEETEAEIDKVLTEVAGESLSGLANAPKNKLAQKQAAKPQEAEEEEAEGEDLAERLRAIRS